MEGTPVLQKDANICTAYVVLNEFSQAFYLKRENPNQWKVIDDKLIYIYLDDLRRIRIDDLRHKQVE